MPEAAVFDFDLTLADSGAPIAVCVSHALSELGLEPASPDQIRRTIGLTLEKGLEQLTGRTEPPLQRKYRAYFLERSDQVMVEQTAFFEGVLSALQELRNQGLQLGIVSTKFRYRIEAILEKHGVSDLVGVIVGAEDTAVSKPDPNGLRIVLNTLGVTAKRAMYVGDHWIDAETARRASVPFVGVLTGTTRRVEFAAYPNVAILSAASDLPSYLRGQVLS